MSRENKLSYSNYYTAAPHDSTNQAQGVFDAIYVGGAGNIVVVQPSVIPGAADLTATFTAVPVGTVLQVRGKRINSTNTTATNMVVLYR